MIKIYINIHKNPILEPHRNRHNWCSTSISGPQHGRADAENGARAGGLGAVQWGGPVAEPVGNSGRIFEKTVGN